MREIKNIFFREFRSYFHTLYGYVLIAFILLVGGIYFSANSLAGGSSAFELSVSNMTFIYLIIIPVLTMRSFAEERRQKTEQLMYSLPVKMSCFVIGKFLALCAVLAVPVLLLFLYPASLRLFGNIDLKSACCALIGFWLLGCTLCSIGLFISSLTDNQAVSASLSFIAMLLLFFESTLAGMIPSANRAIVFVLRNISPFDRYYPFLSGVFSMRSLSYMVSVTVLFIVFTTMEMEGRRRDKKGLYYSLVSVLSVAILVLLDLLIGKMPLSLTELQMNSVGITDFSQETKSIVSALDSDVRIYWITRSGKEDIYVNQLVNEFDRLSDRINVVKVDPVQQPRFTYRYTNRTVNENSLIVECEDQSKYIDFTDLYQNTSSASPSADFYGESLVGSAISYVTDDSEEKIVILTGHGEEKLSETFLAGLKNSNYVLSYLDLLSAGSVPEDCSCLLVTGTPTDITENEASCITSYLDAGGRLLLFSTYLDDTTPNWNSVLKPYGLNPQNGIIIEGNSNYFVANYPYYILPTMLSHPITDSMISAGQRVIIPLSQAVLPDTTFPEKVDILPLLTTSDAAYAKKEGFSMKTTSREEGDLTGKFILAAAAEKEEGTSKSAVIWFPSSYVLSDSINKSVSGGNLQLLLNSVSWLSDSSGSITASAKHIGGGRIIIPSKNANLMSTVLIVLIPALFIGYGIVVVAGRKRR